MRRRDALIVSPLIALAVLSTSGDEGFRPFPIVAAFTIEGLFLLLRYRFRHSLAPVVVRQSVERIETGWLFLAAMAALTTMLVLATGVVIDGLERPFTYLVGGIVVGLFFGLMGLLFTSPPPAPPKEQVRRPRPIGRP
jgi:di/tricarboxylate transporter